MSALLPACNSCRHEKPYTPFGVTSALPVVSPSALLSAAPSASSNPASMLPPIKRALMAPADAQRWNLDGRELESPPDRVFEQALLADFDGDGKQEVAAYTIPTAESKSRVTPGELWFYPPEHDARRLLDFPSFLPTGPNCTSIAALTQTVVRTLTLEIRTSCDAQLIARAPTRALAVIDPTSDSAPRFGLRAAEAAPGETLALELTTRDEDADGRDDYRLTAGIGLGTAAPEVRAALVFFDRAAGVSRDAREPVRSLLDSLKKDLSRAQQKKNAQSALSHVDAARRLLATLCAEGATPRVFDWSGNPLRCGSFDDLVDRMGTIEVNAQLTLGQPRAALSVLARDGWYFGAMRAAARAQLVKDLEKRLTLVPAARIALSGVPKTQAGPAYSSLSFTDDGSLLLLATDGVYRVPPNEARQELDPNAVPWPLEVTADSGQRWLAASYSCDRPEVTLLLAGGTADLGATAALLAPRPGVCAGGRFQEGFTPAPVSVGAAVQALVGGVLVGSEQAKTSTRPGTARSPNSAWLAVPTPLGLWLEGERHELWKIDSFASGTVSGCVVDNTGARAACLRSSKAELYVKSPSQ